MKEKISQYIMTSIMLIIVNSSFAASGDRLSLEGQYNCTGYDRHDGAYAGTIDLKLDAAASDFSHNFGAYTLTLKEKDGNSIAIYTGHVAAHGDLLAIDFQSNNDTTDGGIGIATVSHEQNSNGQFTTTLNKVYYQPTYMRKEKGSTGQTGGNGTEVCIKMV